MSTLSHVQPHSQLTNRFYPGEGIPMSKKSTKQTRRAAQMDLQRTKREFGQQAYVPQFKHTALGKLDASAIPVIAAPKSAPAAKVEPETEIISLTGIIAPAVVQNDKSGHASDTEWYADGGSGYDLLASMRFVASAPAQPPAPIDDEFNPMPAPVSRTYVYTIPERWRNLPDATIAELFAAFDRLADATFGAAANEFSSTDLNGFTRTFYQSVVKIAKLDSNVFDTPARIPTFAARGYEEKAAIAAENSAKTQERATLLKNLLETWLGVRCNPQCDFIIIEGYRYALTPDPDVFSPIDKYGIIIQRVTLDKRLTQIRAAYSRTEAAALRAELETDRHAEMAQHVSPRYEKYRRNTQPADGAVIQRGMAPLSVDIDALKEQMNRQAFAPVKQVMDDLINGKFTPKSESPFGAANGEVSNV
jgi:hypothetical protein